MTMMIRMQIHVRKIKKDIKPGNSWFIKMLPIAFKTGLD